MKFCRLLLLPIIFLATACHDPEGPVDPVVEKPIPVGNRKVNILVDPKYDFREVVAYSLSDSISIHRSPVFFTDEIIGEFLAVVKTDTIGTELEVNATSVALGLSDLLPAYNLPAG